MNIVVDNSHSEVQGLTIQQHKGLADVLSYSVDNKARYFAGGYGPSKITLLSKKGRFPTGLLHLATAHLRNANVIDNRRVPKRVENLHRLSLEFTAYPEQIEIGEAASLMHRGTFVAPTGFGKSVCMALIINALQVRTLIIVPTVNLKHQLRESFTRYFGTLDNITIENIDSPSLGSASNYDCLIIDEAHHVAAKTYRNLNNKTWNSIYYRFFFTATPFRSRDEEQILFESIAGEVIHRVDYKTAVDKGYVVPMDAYYIQSPKSHSNGTTWQEVYKDLVVTNDHRNELIASLLKSLKEAGKSTLCLVKEIEHGNRLSSLAGVMFANGKDQDSKDMIHFFNQGKIKCLIGTSGILGEGVDTKPCEFVIIAGLGKSRNAFMQQCGRGFRKYEGKDSCKIVIIKDFSHKWTKAHYAEQVKTLSEEYGALPAPLFKD